MTSINKHIPDFGDATLKPDIRHNAISCQMYGTCGYCGNIINNVFLIGNEQSKAHPLYLLEPVMKRMVRMLASLTTSDFVLDKP
ncbi:hypothetical protein GDO81_020899 [Engystomops pustulosus]|uniref:Uncharacterized protein n=1 Tax=Engystomops pustulosus TaxID=76066 RepID=A0AAV6YPW2_ENGPU|nr:hypothetical protein GDO81_020899 [Engystomops pustulosus]